MVRPHNAHRRYCNLALLLLTPFIECETYFKYDLYVCSTHTRRVFVVCLFSFEFTCFCLPWPSRCFSFIWTYLSAEFRCAYLFISAWAIKCKYLMHTVYELHGVCHTIYTLSRIWCFLSYSVPVHTNLFDLTKWKYQRSSLEHIVYVYFTFSIRRVLLVVSRDLFIFYWISLNAAP